jgi:hypothetical protein
LIKQFGSAAGGSCHWFCDVCNPKAIDVLKLVQQVKDKNNELDNRLLSVEEKVEKMDNEFEERVTSSVRSVVREEVHEARMREERKLNVVIKNLPEDESDAEMFRRVVAALGLEQNIVDGVKLDRVGTKSNPERPRPLRVQCVEAKQRKDLLSNSKKLARNADFSKVFIDQDLTKNEQIEQKALREELKQKRALNDGMRYKISRKKVVVVEEKDLQSGQGSANGGGSEVQKKE